MIKVSPSAKKLIRFLSALVIFIWLGMYLYAISYRTPPSLYDHVQQLYSKAEELNNNINLDSRISSQSQAIVINYRLLCQNKIL